MAEFLEESLPVCIRVGAVFEEDYDVELTVTENRSEYARVRQPFPVLEADITYTLSDADLRAQVLDLYHRCFKWYAAFRVSAYNYNSTAADDESAPAFNDQPFTSLGSGVYQAIKQYGTGATATSLGYPYRTLYKPQAGTMLIGITDESNNQVQVIQGSRWTVDITTGKVTFAADKTYAVSDISVDSNNNPVLELTGHTLVDNDTIHISSVSGMTEINGLRGTVIDDSVPNFVTLDIDASTFSAYTSGGTVHTQPQSNESVTGGCRFDIPMRFNSKFPRMLPGADIAEANLTLIERVNPT